MKLSELKIGEKASIVKVMGYGGFRKRIVEMGFVKGKIVQALHSAPMGDPILYNIMDYKVSLRRAEAQLIEIVAESEISELPTPENAPSILQPIEENVCLRALEKRKQITVALVGNPNCGKTTLFNFAAGLHEHVGNYSGVTVDAKEGKVKFNGYDITLVDLPGTYSLSPYSPEEKYVRRYIWENKPDVVINVIDSTNLERNLYLTTQLIDMEVLTVIALNMHDELMKKGDVLDHDFLGRLLGFPFVPTVARRKTGIKQLLQTVIELYEHENTNEENAGFWRHIQINHGQELERSISKVRYAIFKNEKFDTHFSSRFLSIKLLENDKDIISLIQNENGTESILAAAEEERKRIKTTLKETAESAITDAKYGFIDGALKETYTPAAKSERKTLTQKIDAIVTNKYLAYPIFAVIIFLMFSATFFFGKYPEKLIEWFVSQLGLSIKAMMQEGILADLITDGILEGTGAVLKFLPNILILYFCMMLLEASGYLARAAFIMDKIMHKIGLHGHSFIPLIMGFGCNVPAIMATRTIENRNNRMVTILVTPFMSCNARLPIFLILAGSVFPEYKALALFGIYFFGIVLAAIFAKIFKRLLLNKNDSPFVMELPSYRVPTMRYTLRETWDKGSQYIKKIGSTVLVGSIIIWALNYFPTNKDEIEQRENSYLAQIGKTVEPVFEPLGYDWKISISLFSGAVAKEMIVSTMSILYNEKKTVPTPFWQDFCASLKEVFCDDETDLSAQLKDAKRTDGTSTYSIAVAISLMLFILIYFPCLATIAAIKNETGSWRWALFSAIYSVVLAWLVAFGVFQIFGS